MRWPDDLGGWPHADRSRIVECRPHRWHVQEMGKGDETLLLLHGAGASTHSWRDLMPMLARDRRVVAIDLPGHGFTRRGAPRRSGLDQMAADIAALVEAESWRPDALIGHSAGAAIALRLSQRMTAPSGDPPAVVGFNAALGEFGGLAGLVFPATARLLAATPFVATLFSRGVSRDGRVRSLLTGTGSDIGTEGEALYARLIGDRDHVAGALDMMAQWKLGGLLADLPRIETKTLLIVGERDAAVPPSVSEAAARRMPHAELVRLPGLGHLAHEEAPALVAERIEAFLAGAR